jgi:uncharacterized protein (TIGR02270 family)
MTAPAIFLAARPIVDILEEHLDELGFLLERRGGAVRSPDYRSRDVRLLDARVVAHADGLVLAGRDAEPLLLEALEDADEPAKAGAAAFVLARAEDSRIDPQPIIDLASSGPPEVVRAIAGALLLAGPGGAREPLAAAVRGGTPRTAAVATLALAGARAPGAAQPLPALLTDDDPLVRELGWRALAVLAWGGGDPAPELATAHSGTWQASLRADCEDPDPEIQQAALIAAVMTRQAFLLPLALQKAFGGTRDDLPVIHLGAALAEPDDLPVFLRLLERRDLGLGRFDVAASYGAPGVVEPLIAAMASPEPAVSLAASAAFRRITGIEIASAGVVRVPADWRDEPDEVDEESMEDVHLPDASDAREKWQAIQGDLGVAPRLCLGVPILVPGAGPEPRGGIDMLAAWHALLRQSYHRASSAAPEDLWRVLRPLE